MKLHLSTQDKINEAIKFLTEIKPNGEYEVNIKKLPKKRTLKQNAALWQYLTLVANALNEAGHEMMVVIFNKEVFIPWNKDTLKEVVWDGISVKMFGKASSTDLETHEVTQVYEVMNRFTSEAFGVGMPWPCLEVAA